MSTLVSMSGEKSVTDGLPTLLKEYGVSEFRVGSRFTNAGENDVAYRKGELPALAAHSESASVTIYREGRLNC